MIIHMYIDVNGVWTIFGAFMVHLNLCRSHIQEKRPRKSRHPRVKKKLLFRHGGAFCRDSDFFFFFTRNTRISSEN